MTEPNKKPRIVFLSHLDFNLYRFRLNLMQRLLNAGFDVYALCPSGDYSVNFKNHGIIHVDYPIDRSSMNPFRELVALLSIAHRLYRIKPVILQTHTMKPNIYGAFAGALVGVPIIVSSVTGLGSFFIKGISDSVKVRIVRKGLGGIYSFALKLVDKIVFLNSADMREFVGAGVVDERNSILLPGDGINSNHFRRKKARPLGSGTKNCPIRVLMVSRLIRDKGVNEFLNAANIVKKELTDRVVFALAGFEDEGNPWPADIKKIRDYSADKVIEFLGYREDIRDLLEQTDIYVLPSYREGLSVSILEAMSMGLPVITTDAPGCKDLVSAGINGEIVPIRDSKALAASILRLINRSDLRVKYGLASRAIVDSKYSNERVGAMMMSLYSEQLRAKGIDPVLSVKSLGM